MKKVISFLVMMFIGTNAFAVNNYCMDQLIPMYIYPSQSTSTAWDQLQSTSQQTANQILIMNPASGVGSSSNSDYVTEVGQQQSSGNQVIGYIPTSYGANCLTDMMRQVRNYIAWYGVDGIFFDEASTSTDPDIVAYYAALVDYVNDQLGNDAIVVLNHGTEPPHEYLDLSFPSGSKLIHVTFEGKLSDYVNYTPSSLITSYSIDRIANLVYSSPTSTTEQKQAGLDAVHAKNVKYFYLTNDILPNPWDTLNPANWFEVQNTKCQ